VLEAIDTGAIVQGGGCTAAKVGQQDDDGGVAGGPWLLYVDSNPALRPTARMDFRILGPLEVLDEGRQVALEGSKQRALLAVLLLHANETLSTDRLLDELWGERPPATAAKSVQVHISRLRKALAGGTGDRRADLLVTRGHGYQLEIDPERLDSHRFERLAAEGRSELAARHPERAASALERALSLWRGTPLADLAYERFAQREIARLDDLKVAAQELLIEAKLALAAHADVVGQLETLIGEHPYRERLRAQLMLALYRCDRQADALQAYQDARRTLVEELGIEPGERLRDLEGAILAQDPALAAPVLEADELPVELDAEARLADSEAEIAPHDADGTRAARRLVSIVFADLVGSTGLAERLDPESMHELLDRYTDVCSAVIERHGGTVEGFIGDAVVGVFGLTELREDDALRAVRTAVDLREGCAALSAELAREQGIEISVKLGVESGQVFISSGERRSTFAAGDAFNVAARLEGAAAEGEVLLGETVYGMVRRAVRAERLEPLAVKGRTAKVQAWRLVDLEVEDPGRLRAPESRFVNRERELDELQKAFARARRERTLHAATVVGPAGIGKSRLAQELVAAIGDQATVVVGRCLSYSEGVTYRPLTEIVRQLGGADPREGLRELLEGDDQVARLVLGAIGLADAAAQAEETFWAVRTLLERVARERPLVVVVEDVHWAEPTLLDLLEYLVAFSSGYPILLLCIARPEFVETRPTWVALQPNRSVLAVDALTDAEAHQLVEAARPIELESRTATRIVETAEGNPLFLEQLVAVGAEAGEAALPSSIQAVLAARIERLEPGQRSVLELASVQGRSFYVGAVSELLGEPDRADIATRLVSLVHEQLIRPDRSEFPGQDAFRFTHVLIREAAYQGLPRQRRADLHERVAQWLASWPGAPDETVGYHLGEAYRHLAELGRVGERERALAAAAAERLAAAGGAALRRGDPPAGARLLEQAERLIEPDDPTRSALLPRLGAALLEAGRLADADRVLAEAIERSGGDPRLETRARVERQLVRLQTGSSDPTEDTGRIADSALRVAEAHKDELGQCRALYLRALQAWLEGSSARADEAWQRAAKHARRANDEAALFGILDWRAAAALFGPTPVPAAIARCQEIHEQVRSSPVAVARTSHPMAALHAMAGDFEEARRLVQAGEDVLGELGGLHYWALAQLAAQVEMLADRPAAAEARLRGGYERLEEMGEKALLATTAAMLAEALYDQAQHDEAGDFCLVSEEAAAEEDLTAQVGWRAVRAKLHAAQGRLDEAEALAAEAVHLAERTDFLTDHAQALLDLGTVYHLGGKSEDANAAIRAALELHRQKGNHVSAERARSRLRGGAEP
jgi:DNA-binding SARP family transcriptional activator